ncbi:MAG: phosphoribosylformylglycinamidine synthase subunit PurS [Deltaproteobacteria bacterium]|nr:MAG: phosphoribosylformylglycinamidine synthase subunit PurS [Deltaproteobacteria bacterium]
MGVRLEITLKPELFDAEGEAIRRKARDYFNIYLEEVRTIHVLTIDADLTREQIESARHRIFTNPVSQISSFEPLATTFDWAIWVGLRPGVRDNAGSTAVEAMEDLLKVRFQPGEAVYTSRLYLLRGERLRKRGKGRRIAESIAKELLANDLIQQWRVYSAEEWDPEQGIGIVIPKVRLAHQPTVDTFSIDSDEELQRLSHQRNLALHPRDIPVIRSYFLRAEVRAARRDMGLSDPTDVELEYISQARSDHCNHNTFRGKFFYRDLNTGETEVVDNLFKTCIEAPTLDLQKKKDWVISVLWDNAGVARFDQDNYYVITGETHNSPSNMEAYGGALTGIVGVYRDPMGTGKGSRLIAGTYGYCVGFRDYSGPLRPHLHPRRLLDGVIEGVRDGGNKSGIPTPYGQVFFDHGYMGKCLVFVTAVGMMPAQVADTPCEEKTTTDADLILMCGGRVGKDGIHGVTASSEIYSEHTPAGHVQIGDPYTQKKMLDFLLEARDEGLIAFLTDNGGGGLSSSIGESALFSGGAMVELEKVPLKYEGLDVWEIWVSESQERMTVAVKLHHLERFMQLSRKHEVESTVIGRYTDSGKLHLTYKGETCAYVDLDLLESGFPQWEFEAEWLPPRYRGFSEPVLGSPEDHRQILLTMLSQPNICSKEWIVRQYDHEVQGSSVIKHLVGVHQDVPSDAVVQRPHLDSPRGLAITQALNPTYSRVDAYHMVASTIDETVRRLLAVGGTFEHLAGVDNFCWPNIQYHPQSNPDGKFKAAQLVRANWALRDYCIGFGIPLLSGKDSMYVDGNLEGSFGERHKVSGLETLQFTGTSVIDDVRRCVTMDVKMAGDFLYVLGLTRDELGGSEYYDLFNYTGLHVPQVRLEEVLPLYRALEEAIGAELVASVHGIYRGGLGVHLALVAMAGGFGLEVDLALVPTEGVTREDTLLYSESAGRFIVTVAPEDQSDFEARFRGLRCAKVGKVTENDKLTVNDLNGNILFGAGLQRCRSAWKKPFGNL